MAVARATCQILFAPGAWTTGSAHFAVRRGHTMIARGSPRETRGRLVVRLTHGLRPGRYRVTVTTGRGRLTRTVRVG